MFCGCAVTKGEPPNTHTCPVCLAHPGALPVVNQRAVEYAARIALALDCTVLPRSIFHRKNYFYPDLPKAYQISQYDEPLAVRRRVRRTGSAASSCSCRINRVHMEEDAAKLVHAGGDAGRIAGSDYSMVDFNRGGTPLIEIVSEPDIPSPEAARRVPAAAARRWSSSSASASATWKRARSAGTPTSASSPPAATGSGRAPSSRT